jgi:hypothetical protein
VVLSQGVMDVQPLMMAACFLLGEGRSSPPQAASEYQAVKYEPFISWPISANVLCEVFSGCDSKKKSPA